MYVCRIIYTYMLAILHTQDYRTICVINLGIDVQAPGMAWFARTF